MIIPNPVVKLHYNPAQDILSVEWPEVHDYSVGEADYVLNVVVETVKYYDVKYLLTDVRKGIVDIPEPQYKEMILKFAKGLAATRLQKLARVVTESTLREEPIREVRQKAQLAVPFKNFNSVEEAVDWLTFK